MEGKRQERNKKKMGQGRNITIDHDNIKRSLRRPKRLDYKKLSNYESPTLDDGSSNDGNSGLLPVQSSPHGPSNDGNSGSPESILSVGKEANNLKDIPSTSGLGGQNTSSSQEVNNF